MHLECLPLTLLPPSIRTLPGGDEVAAVFRNILVAFLRELPDVGQARTLHVKGRESDVP